MTQYDETVETQRLIIEAEKWAKELRGIHMHSMNSMYYDDRPEDTKDGKSVTDHEFNDGVIERYQAGKLIHTFGKRMNRAELLDAYTRKGA